MSTREVIAHPGVLVQTGPDARAAWEAIARTGDHLAVSQLPAWSDFVCASGRFVPATRCYRTPDGRTLVLALVRRRLSRDRLGLFESWPFGWDAGADNGGLVSDGPVGPADVAMVASDLAQLPAARVRITPSVADAPAWRAADLSGWRTATSRVHVVRLPEGGGPSPVDGMSSNARRKLRKGERAFEIESDASGRLLPVFEDLYRRSQDGWAEDHWLPTPAARRLLEYRDPPQRRLDLARRLGAGYRVWVAWLDGVPVASIVVLSAGPAAAYWGGATDKEAARNHGVGQVLHVRAMEAAAAEGRLRYDLSSSGSDALVHFKESIGGRPVEPVSYGFERLPVTDSEHALRSAARRAFTLVALARARRR